MQLTALSKGQECTMVVFVNLQHQQVLLKIPNELGWRLHFGCDVLASDKEDGATLWKIARETAMKHAGEALGLDLKLRPAGLMLFTFVDNDHPPMRVRVFESNIPSPDDCALGQFYRFDNVPYSEMWADDKFWLPDLLEKEDGYFEAHFVFRGPPGSSIPLVQHKYVSYS